MECDQYEGWKVITIWIVDFWNGGGAIESVLETPNLVKLQLITSTKNVPIFIIFLWTVHKAAIDSHWGGIIIITVGVWPLIRVKDVEQTP